MSTSSTKSAVMFDLGGTLVEYYDRARFPEVLRQAIVRVSDHLQLQALLRVTPDDMWRSVAQEDHEATDHRVRPLEERLARVFRLEVSEQSDELMTDICRAFMQPIFALRHLYEDALPALQDLRSKGLKVAIVSNTPWGSPANLWGEEVAALGLAGHVDASVFCRDAGWRKPATPVFELALQKLKAQASDCLFVGDDPRWDVAGPKALGMDAVLIDRLGENRDDSNASIGSLRELWSRLR